jgi:hypothetical protein
VLTLPHEYPTIPVIAAWRRGYSLSSADKEEGMRRLQAVAEAGCGAEHLFQVSCTGIMIQGKRPPTRESLGGKG